MDCMNKLRIKNKTEQMLSSRFIQINIQYPISIQPKYYQPQADILRCACLQMQAQINMRCTHDSQIRHVRHSTVRLFCLPSDCLPVSLPEAGCSLVWQFCELWRQFNACKRCSGASANRRTQVTHPRSF